MYWFDTLVRDGWMGLRIYLQVCFRRFRFGNGPVTITIDIPGIEPRTPTPDETLAHEVVFTLARGTSFSRTEICPEWLSQLKFDHLPWEDGESRQKALSDYLSTGATRQKGHLSEHEFLLAIFRPSRRPGVVILQTSEQRALIIAYVLTPVAWRIHQIKRRLGGWQKYSPNA